MLNLMPATLALILVLPCITWQGIAIKVSTATASPSNIALMEGIRRTAVGVGSLSSSSASLSSSSSSSSSPPSSLGIRRTAVGVGSWHRSCLLVRDWNVRGGYLVFSLSFCFFLFMAEGQYNSDWTELTKVKLPGRDWQQHKWGGGQTVPCTVKL